jgi:hypothetical protein
MTSNINNIINDYQVTTKTLKQIALENDTTVYYINKILKENNIEKRKKKSKVVEVDPTTAYNPKQEEFMNDVKDFIEREQTGMIVLNAPGGTGKTYCLKKLFKEMNKKVDIEVLAPTHKAKTLFPYEFRAKTVHSYLNCLPDYKDNGEQVFLEYTHCLLCHENIIDKDRYEEHILNCNKTITSNNPYETRKYKVIFADESSMMCPHMLNAFKMDSLSSLIIFTGDDHQIPPVNYVYSPIFRYEHVLKKYSFDQQMRAKNDTIRKFCEAFRSAIDDRVHVNTTKTPLDVLIQSFKNKEDTVVLSYTNDQKKKYNYYIRRKLFLKNPNDRLLDYYVGENLWFTGFRSRNDNAVTRDTYKGAYSRILETYDTYVIDIVRDYLEDPSTEPCCRDPWVCRKYCGHTIYNTNDLIRVVNVSSVEIEIPYYKCTHGEYKCKICKIILPQKKTESEVIQLYKITDEDGTPFYKVQPQSLIKFNKVLNHYKDMVLQRHRTERKPYWRDFYMLKDTLNAQLDYCYSMTVHKSQGSQWSKVFVNIDNIRRDQINGYRLAYTAVSRAMDNLYFLSEIYSKDI